MVFASRFFIHRAVRFIHGCTCATKANFPDMKNADYLRLSPDGIASSSDWWRSGAQRAFGGQLVAHAMLATSRACAANPATQGFGFHSIKISFLTAGQCVDTKYKVEPLRIGRTYAVFQCSGIEVEERSPLVVATISFARAERGPFLHQDPLPAVRLPPPDFLQSARSSEEDAPWPCVVAADDTGRRWYITWAGLGAGDGSGATLQRTSPRICHAAALGFLSDFNFMWAGFASNPQCANFDHSMSASLDHSFFLHEPDFDASGCLLYEVDSPWSAYGRTFCRGKVWEVASGTLIASTVQEGVFRVAPKRPSHARL